ncbi:MAG: hypothetical protein J5873_03215 [Bacteroidales bacterium]|nr:hypothetical protein [Bacteroidales bacterium]
MKQKIRLMFRRGLALCMAMVSCAVYAQENLAKPQTKEPAKLKISGWAQVQCQSEWQEGELASQSFRIRRARLVTAGQLHPMLSYKVQADFGNSPALVDAYLNLRFCDAFSLQAGQFKYPLSIESNIGPMDLEYIDYGDVIQKLVGYNDVCGVGKQGRDIGLMATGKLFAVDGREKPFHLLHYSLGVFNGNGINGTDANLHKDVVGKLDFHPWLPTLTISASCYEGVWKQNENGNYKRERFAAGVQYDDKKLVLRSEYLWGHIGQDLDSIPNSDQLASGWYALAGWWFRWQSGGSEQRLFPYIRYDHFQSGEAAADAQTPHFALDQSDAYSVGVNYHPFPSLQCRVAYTLRQTSKENLSKTADRHQLYGMLCFKF